MDGTDTDSDTEATTCILWAEEYDEGAEGTVDRRVTYTYDSYGNLVVYKADSDANGTVDSLSILTDDCR